MHLRRSGPAASPSGAHPARVLPARRQPAAVAAESARRFAARARQRRRLALRPLLVLVGVLGLLGTLAWVVLGSSLLAVRHVVVTGTQRLAVTTVEEQVDGTVGTPLARVDTGAEAARLDALPLVLSADVVRAWPGTLEVRVVERTPVAAVRSGSGFDVVDRTGQTVLTTTTPPADVPVVAVDRGSAATGTVEAVTQVLDELPASLRARLATAGAGTPDSVVLTLRDGARVVWGDARQGALKAEVLAALLQRPAAVYDVSSPTAPVTRDE